MYKPKSRFSTPHQNKRRKEGWEEEAPKYNDLVGARGHYFHDHVVIPGSLKLLNLTPQSSVLDLGCGQGVLSRALPKTVSYVGVDSSASLIKFAENLSKNIHHKFVALSVTRPLKGIRRDFTHAVCVLALQNMEYPANTIKNAREHLSLNGHFLIVLNHPAFRTPRQSGWEENESGVQYRWVNRYMSQTKIPITMHPSNKKSAVTMTYHYPLSSYVRMLKENGFVVEALEEWTSDRESRGKHAKRENTARAEIPLFMAILARKVS